jgi:hypothetical protein
VVTRSLKWGTIWRIDFQKKGDFHQKIWAMLPVGDFLPKKRKDCSKLAHFQVLVNHL